MIVKVDFALLPIARAIIGKTGDIDLAGLPDKKLRSIALTHAVSVATLELIPGWLGFRFDSDKVTVFLRIHWTVL